MPKTTPPGIDRYWHKPGLYGIYARAALRTLQFIFALTVAGLYGVDLAHASKTNTHAHSEWIYAEFVAAVSAITCVVHCFVTVVRVAWSAWDGFLFVLWLAQVGVFGAIYISDKPADGEEFATSVPRMRAAVWINLINMLLWLVTFVLGIAWCIRTRKMTRQTDRLGFLEGKLVDLRGDEEKNLCKDMGKDEEKVTENLRKDKRVSCGSDEDMSETGSMVKKMEKC